MTGLLGQQGNVNDATPEHVAAFLAKRDLSVDLIRISCVLLVVVIHTLLVGVSTTGGQISITKPGQEHAWFPYLTWFLQIMPLFFIVGGFASWQGWASTQRKGGTWRDFYRVRVLRLVYPAAIWFTVIGIILWAAKLLGAPGGIIDSVVGGIGSPLWFLAAYLWTQLLVPVLVYLHKTRPYLTIAVMFLLCIVIDVLRYSTGITNLGLLNMLVLWPLAQQLGFFYADGSVRRIPRWALPLIAIAGFGFVALLGETGPYSKDMLDNLNPPTVPLLFIGLAHLALFVLAKPALDKLMHHRFMQGLVLFLGSRAMTIYLWHLLFVIIVNALILVIPSLPQADTSAWWATRIPVILLEYGLILLLSLGLARFERGPSMDRIHRAPSAVVTGIIAACSIIPPFYALQFKLDMPELIWGTLLLWIAVRLARGFRGRIIDQNSNSSGSAAENNSSVSQASS